MSAVKGVAILVALNAASAVAAQETVHWDIRLEDAIVQHTTKGDKERISRHPLQVLLVRDAKAWTAGVAVIPLDPDRPSQSFTSAGHAIDLTTLGEPASQPPAQITCTLGPERTGNPGDPFPKTQLQHWQLAWRAQDGAWAGTWSCGEGEEERTGQATAVAMPGGVPAPAHCIVRFEGALGPMSRHWGAPSRLLLDAAIAADGSISETSVRGTYGGWQVSAAQAALRCDGERIVGSLVFTPESQHGQYDDRFTLHVTAQVIAGHMVGSFTGERHPLPEGEKSKKVVLAHSYEGDIVGRVLRDPAEP